MYVIYRLIDQRYRDVRYVGITDNVYERFLQHIRCLGDNLEKNAWIEELRDANVMLIMETIEVTETLEDARKREDYWIQYYLDQGASLLNQRLARSFTFEDFQRKMQGKGFFRHAKREKMLPNLENNVELVQHIRAELGKKKQYITFEDASFYTGYSISELQELVRKGRISRGMATGNKLLISSLKGIKVKK